MSPGARVLSSQKFRGRAIYREAALVAVLYGLATLLLGILFSHLWQPIYALGWTMLATTTLGAILWLAFHFLHENYHPSTQVTYQSLGPANHVSLLRGVLLSWLAGFLLLPRPAGWPVWLPAALYTTAIILDGLDGLLARLTQHVSKLGQRLDIELDGLGVLVASAIGIGWGQLPPWYALVALAYYAFAAGQLLRRKMGREVFPLPPSATRRTMAGIQMGFISVALWPTLSPVLTRAAATLVMVPFLAGFMRDWLMVCGRLDISSSSYRTWVRRLAILMERWMPVPIRIGVLLVFLLNVLLGGHLALFTEQPLPGSLWLTALGALIVAGVMGRTAGTLLAVSISLAATRLAPPTPSAFILIGSGLMMLLFGSGNLSIWQPEEALLRVPHGRES